MTAHTLLLTYTPGAGVDLDTYHAWLRATDNPFFNSRPSVRRYVNYRIVAPVLGTEGFTHFDLLEIEGGGGPDAVFGDPEITAFARAWVEQWGQVPDPDLPNQSVNYRVLLCETVASPEGPR